MKNVLDSLYTSVKTSGTSWTKLPCGIAMRNLRTGFPWTTSLLEKVIKTEQVQNAAPYHNRQVFKRCRNCDTSANVLLYFTMCAELFSRTSGQYYLFGITPQFLVTITKKNLIATLHPNLSSWIVRSDTWKKSIMKASSGCAYTTYSACCTRWGRSAPVTPGSPCILLQIRFLYRETSES